MILMSDIKKHVEEITKKAHQGDPAAQRILGYYYLKGTHCKRNYRSAAKWLKLALEQGEKDVFYALGECYWNSEGATQNRPEAIKLWQLAADNGDSFALYQLGMCYWNGEYVKKSKKEAIRLWELGAKNDDERSCVQLGKCYYLGDGVKQDYEKAVELFATAENYEWLGECYLHGHGVDQDVERAIELWESLADRGETHIYMKLAQIYSDGIVVKPDFETALYWWEMAASDENYSLLKGNSEAQYKMACCYYEANGTERNVRMARKYFKLAIRTFRNSHRKYTISQEPDYIINSRKFLIKHRDKDMLEKVRTASDNGDKKATEILDELGLIARRIKISDTKKHSTVGFSVGDTVTHKTFGEGTVIEVNDATIRIKFKSVGEKTLANSSAFF